MYNIRDAREDDSSAFTRLVDGLGGLALLRATFGQFNYPSLIENSYVSVVAVTSSSSSSLQSNDHSCCGCLFLNDSISITSSNNDDADTFSQTIALLKPYIPSVRNTNTLFVNFWLSDPNYDGVNFDLIRDAFIKFPTLDHIIWICPIGVRMSDAMNRIFTTIPTTDTTTDTSFQNSRVLSLDRSEFLSKLTVRDARAEDNDDILPILSKYLNNFNDKDQYFLTDAIQNQDERNRFYVGLSNNAIEGALMTSLDVNVSLIAKLFDLDAFPNILTEKQLPHRPFPSLLNLVGDLRAINKSGMMAVLSALGILYIDYETIVSSTTVASRSSRSTNDDALIDNTNNNSQDHLKIIHDINSYIDKTFSSIDPTAYPVAICLAGFPRTEREAEAISSYGHYLNLTARIELQNISDDGDADIYDEAISMHLDALEVLRNSQQHELVSMSDSNWTKVIIDGEVDACIALESTLLQILQVQLTVLKEMKEANEREDPTANGFAVTVFCINELYQSRGDDLLKIAFEDYPDLDYCFYMVPNNAPPSILTRSMYYVKPRVGVSYDQALFIIHRDVILVPEYLEVVRYSSKHTDLLSNFIEPLHTDKADILAVTTNGLLDNIIDLVDNPGDVTFVAMMGNDIVGFISMTRKSLNTERVNAYRCKYQIDDYCNIDRHRVRSQASILHWTMNPLFACYSRYILREAMRSYNKTLLYYVLPSDNVIPPIEVTREMVPIRPIRGIQPIRAAASKNKSAAVAKEVDSATDAKDYRFPMYVIKKSIVSQRKISVYNRILLVGGSSSSYAILEHLHFVPHLNFPNLTYVIRTPPHQFSNQDECSTDDFYSNLLEVSLTPVDADDNLNDELSSLGLQYKGNIIHGHLTDIDRSNKGIVVSDEMIVEYDLLLLSSPSQDNYIKQLKEISSLHPSVSEARGIFGIGNSGADRKALRWMKAHQGPRNIVIFGTVLSALHAAFATMANSAADANRIVILLQENSIDNMGDAAIDAAVLAGLNESGIVVYYGCKIGSLVMSNTNIIQSVMVEFIDSNSISSSSSTASNEQKATEGHGSSSDLLEIICSTVLLCSTRHCDSDTFAAINDCGLIYDGGIVVDESFCTVDPTIYAVGDITKFSRLHRGAISHSRINAREAGRHVACHILDTLLDPKSPTIDYNRSRHTNIGQSSTRRMYNATLPTFHQARSITATLPGNLHYFKSSLPNYSTDTNAYVTSHNGRVCMVKIDHLGVVVEIIYVGDVPIEERNLSCLVGLHESYLNHAVDAYERSLMDDWIEFFRESWAVALFHHKFTQYIKQTKVSLAIDQGLTGIIEDVLAVASKNTDDMSVSSIRRDMVGQRCEKVNDNTAKAIEMQIMEFIKCHQQLLPQYNVSNLSKK